MSGPGFRCPRCECLCQYCGHADVPGVPHVSVFASWLRRFMDEACTYSRAEWTEILGVPATAISQWVSDEAFPSAEALRRLRAMMVEEETTPGMGVFLADFDGLASQPMSRIAPKWNGALFRRLALSDPGALVDWSKMDLSLGLLSRAVEAMALIADHSLASERLIKLLCHAEPGIQEATIYALGAHMSERVREELQRYATASTTHPLLRETAQEVLEG